MIITIKTNLNTLEFSKEKGSYLDSLFQQLRLRRIKKYIRNGSVVCDFGCGYEGIMLHNIRNKICIGIGLDIKINPQYSKHNITLKEADLDQPLEIKDNYFDIVTSLANIEHLENPDHIIKEMHRILKPGGTLLMTAPSRYGKPVLEFLAYKLHMINEQSISTHKTYFDKKSLTVLCKNAGFIMIKHRYFQLFMNNFLYAKK